MLANIIQNLLYAMYYSKYFTFINSLNPHSHFIGEYSVMIMPMVQITNDTMIDEVTCQSYTVNDNKARI